MLCSKLLYQKGFNLNPCSYKIWRSGLVSDPKWRIGTAHPACQLENSGATRVRQFENTYFTEVCIGSEAGSYLRLVGCVYHSTLGLGVIKKMMTLPGMFQDEFITPPKIGRQIPAHRPRRQCRGTSLIRNRHPVPYRRPMPRVLGG